MEKLSVTPEKFFEHIQHNAGYVILKIVYGYELQETNDPYLRLVLDATEGFRAGSNHGSFWVDYFPLLKFVPAWLPGASFKRKALRWRQFNKALKDEPWDWVKRALTVSSILTFVMAMALHPEFQFRAQAEIDTVVGFGRVPDIEDQDKLPFVNAILAEAARWHPVTPLGGLSVELAFLH
ncbi:hypothetical protein PM082_016496 [Marasmius tenuissimus]|nr:hypothetical protein PM082_016496 [Marasmius tenuissimus]